MREITDADGDGVEDNVHYESHELDKFYKPAVYGTIEHIHNTRNGELPGHHLKEDHPVPGRHNTDLLKDGAFVQVAGPEKNQYYTDAEYARFEKPVFGDGDDFHNTQSGEMPGHWRGEDFPKPTWHSQELALGRTNPDLSAGAPEPITRAMAEAQADIAR